jgi:hypothetical protein
MRRLAILCPGLPAALLAGCLAASAQSSIQAWPLGSVKINNGWRTNSGDNLAWATRVRRQPLARGHARRANAASRKLDLVPAYAADAIADRRADRAAGYCSRRYLRSVCGRPASRRTIGASSRSRPIHPL